MSSTIAHVAYALEWCNLHPVADEGALIRGSVFPDIRYMAEISRSKTHWPFKVTLGDVKQETDPWKQGVLLHNWIDDEWNRYFERYGLVFGSPKNDELQWAALKVLEERWIRNNIEDPVGVAAKLMGIDPGVAEYGIGNEIVKRWGELAAGLMTGEWLSDAWRRFFEEGLHVDDSGRDTLIAKAHKLDAEGVWQGRLEDCRLHIVGIMAHG